MNHVDGATGDNLDNSGIAHNVSTPSDTHVLHPSLDIGGSTKKWARRKRLSFVDDLIARLDLLIYAEIAILYYMDNSTVRFAIRCMTQLIYLTPKTPTSSFPEPPHQPYVGGIIGSNVICLLCHLIFARPVAGELTRGYLTGGLILDFIGQTPPSSKLKLIVLDLLILVMQSVALAATVIRKELVKQDTRRSQASGRDSRPAVAASTTQDHDAEEQGVLRHEGTSTGATQQEEEVDTHTAAEPRETTEESQTKRISFRRVEEIYSGQSTIAELLVWDTFRQQHTEYLSQTYRFASPLSPELQAHLARSRWQLNLPFRS